MIIHSKLTSAASGSIGLDITFSGTLLCRVSPGTFVEAAKALSLEVGKSGPVAVGPTGWWTVAKEMAARATKAASKRAGRKLDLQQAKQSGTRTDDAGESVWMSSGFKRLDIRAYDGNRSKASVVGSLWVNPGKRIIEAQEGEIPSTVVEAIQKAATDGDVYERRACGRLVSTGFARLGGRPICLHTRAGRYFVPLKHAESVLRALNAMVADSRGEFTYMATNVFPEPAQVAPVMTGTVMGMETRLQEEVDYFSGINWYQPRQANAAKRHLDELQGEFKEYEKQMKELLASVETAHSGWVSEIQPHLEEWGIWATETLDTLESAVCAVEGCARARHALAEGDMAEAPISSAEAVAAERDAEREAIAARDADVEEVSWDAEPEETPAEPEPSEPKDGGSEAIDW